jgi:hypothetical protein
MKRLRDLKGSKIGMIWESNEQGRMNWLCYNYGTIHLNFELGSLLLLLQSPKPPDCMQVQNCDVWFNFQLNSTIMHLNKLHWKAPLLDACSDVPLHHRRSLSSFSFSCTHSSSASSWTALRQWGEHHVSFALFEFSLPRSVSKYIFRHGNLCLVGRHCSNIIVESRDEILFKGGRLWHPRFSAGFINPNAPVNRVDFGQTTVNPGHHLENITNNP